MVTKTAQTEFISRIDVVPSSQRICRIMNNKQSSWEVPPALLTLGRPRAYAPIHVSYACSRCVNKIQFNLTQFNLLHRLLSGSRVPANLISFPHFTQPSSAKRG